MNTLVKPRFLFQQWLKFHVIDWAQPDLPVFPDEATVAKVKVAMPKSLIKEYNLKQESGIVEIDNPLYSYHFQDNTEKMFKVSTYTIESTCHTILGSSFSETSTNDPVFI